MGILIQSSLANATEKLIALDQKSTAKLVTDLEFLNQTNVNLTEQLQEYIKLKTSLENESKLKDIKIEGLTKDYQIQQDRANQFQNVYTQCSQDLTKEKESKPSRFTWFSIGFISALVIGVASAFAVR